MWFSTLFDLLLKADNISNLKLTKMDSLLRKTCFMKKKKWERLLGSSLLQKLYDNIPEVKFYLNDQNSEKYEKEADSILDRAQQAEEDLPINLKRLIIEFVNQKNDDYIQLYVPFLMLGCEKLCNKILGVKAYTSNIYKCFMESLLDDLEMLSIRILINELKRGQKNAVTYKQFISRLGCDAYRKDLFKSYSALEQIFSQCIDRKTELFADVIIRFENNKKEIQKTIFKGKYIGKVEQIETRLSDPHRSGKQVLRIKTNNKKRVIYKPHSLENEKWFYQFVNQMGKQCQLKMYVPELLTYKEYGWSEEIVHKPCKTENEVKNYYRRIGLLLSTTYILGTQDIHCENLIAMGENPVIVDLESLSAIRSIPKKEESDFMYLRLQESVLASGSLPHYYWKSGTEGIDLSAMSGGAEGRATFRIPVVQNWGTENIHVTYGYPKITQKLNKPVLCGKTILPDKYEYEVLGGFELGYQYAMQYSKEIKAKLGEIRDFKCRYLIADTQKYSMLLQSSTHPEVMHSNFERKLLLYFLWKNRDFSNEFDRRIVNAEIRDLLIFDFPYFYFYVGEKDLYDSEGKKIEKYFTDSAEDQIFSRLERLCVHDLDLQKRLIHISLNAYKKQDLKQEQLFKKLRKIIRNPAFYTKKIILESAEYIGLKILSEAIYSQNSNEVRWIVYDVLKEKPGAVNIAPCNMYLYNGISGILIFFYLLKQYSENQKFADMFKMLEHQIYDYTCRVRKKEKVVCEENCGLYNGEASIVYTYLILYWESGEKKYLKYAEEHAEILARIAERDSKIDLLEGKAGALLAFCYLYQIKKKEKYLLEARKIADQILESSVEVSGGIGWRHEQNGRLLLGMAHGNAGIMVAMSNLYQLTREKKYYECFQKAFIYEYQNYDLLTGDWKDFRRDGFKEGIPAAWCHGSGGILLSRLLIYEMDLEEPEKEMCREDIYKAARYLEKYKLREDLCLCHGECGNNLIERKFLRAAGKANNGTESSVEYNFGETIVLGKEWGNPGLLNGTAGIGYYLLMQLIDMKDFILDLPICMP